MYKKFLAILLLFMGVILWLLKSLHTPQANQPDLETGEGQAEIKDELDEDQAAEFVATWTLLNPPS